MAFACTVLPIPKAAMAVKTQKTTPSHFMPRPRSRAYIGPPIMRPLALRTRYFMAKSPSAYLVAMPNTPVSQHQSTAPGPPSDMAVATPMMLPVPMVAASEVASAPNWLTSPRASGSFFTDRRIAVPSLRCGTFSRNVRKMWVPSKSTIIGHPHIMLLSASMMDENVCICMSNSHLKTNVPCANKMHHYMLWHCKDSNFRN